MFLRAPAAAELQKELGLHLEYVPEPSMWGPSAGQANYPHRCSANDCKLAGFSALASQPGLFTTPYKDVKMIPAEQGAAAIASHFGIIVLNRGQFNPQKSMTVADAAVAIVRALQLGSNS